MWHACQPPKVCLEIACKVGNSTFMVECSHVRSLHCYSDSNASNTPEPLLVIYLSHVPWGKEVSHSQKLFYVPAEHLRTSMCTYFKQPTGLLNSEMVSDKNLLRILLLKSRKEQINRRHPRAHKSVFLGPFLGSACRQ